MTILPVEPEFFVTPDDAAAMLGITPRLLRTLIRRKRVPYRGSAHDPLVPISAVRQLGRKQAEVGTNESGASLKALLPTEERDGAEHGAIELPTPTEGAFRSNHVVVGDVLDVLRVMPSSCVQAVVTSPPFWGQRVYEDEAMVNWRDGTTVAFGRESTPEAYVDHTLEILGNMARVLRPTGTIWWNVGDTYMTRTILRTSSKERIDHYGGHRTTWADNRNRRYSSRHSYLKDKDLTLIPFHIAVGAQRLGYWVRSIIIWSKQHSNETSQASDRQGESAKRSHVPESVLDRPVVGHEYILLLAREKQYDYFLEGLNLNGSTTSSTDRTPLNARSVWSFRPVDRGSKHGARFPDELPRRCILLASREGDLIFDPFAGEGTTLRVARALGRHYFGCDISPTYVRAAEMQLAQALLPEQSPGPAVS